MCIVAVQHSHGGQFAKKNLFPQFYRFRLSRIKSLFILSPNITTLSIMPRGTTKYVHLRAQAALARSARSSSRNSQNPSIPSADYGTTSSITSANSTPPMSPMASEPSNDFDDIDNDGFEEIPAAEEDQASETHKDPEDTEGDDEDGYGTWDDMSEFEDDELKDSLERQKAVEAEQGPKSAFELLMEGNTAAKWDNAESNRHLGYGSKNSGRTQRRRQKNKREAEEKNKKSRNSSVNQ